jgi:organic hydroperoxide reductase OsmC/OhrA
VEQGLDRDMTRISFSQRRIPRVSLHRYSASVRRTARSFRRTLRYRQPWHFGLRPDGGFGLEITLEVSLPGFAPADAQTLMEKARHICSLCDATRKEVLRLKLV